MQSVSLPIHCGFTERLEFTIRGQSQELPLASVNRVPSSSALGVPAPAETVREYGSGE